MNKTMLKTAGFTILALALLNRVAAAKEAISGDEKFLGIF